MGDLIWAFPMFLCACKVVKQEREGFRCINCKRRFTELPVTKQPAETPSVLEFRKAS